MIFISHSSTDGELAAQMRDRLVARGYGWLFLDFDVEEGRGIEAGRSWERTLYAKLEGCQAVIALCTDHYLPSHWCFAEVALARMLGKPIFTVLADPLDRRTERDRIPSILLIDQYVDLRVDAEQGYDRLFKGLTDQGLLPSVSRAPDSTRPPYPGLAAYQREDASYFFGREKKIEQGLQQLRRIKRLGTPGMLMVLGSSGSGKSSLVRAGIIPRLEREPGSWLLVGPVRARVRPLRALAEALARAGHPDSAGDVLRRLRAGTGETAAGMEGEKEADLAAFRAALDELRNLLPVTADPRLAGLLEELDTRADAVRPEGGDEEVDEPILCALSRDLLRARERPDARVLLIVDQFEESLGGPEGRASGSRFLRVLRQALEVRGGPLMALGTMRSDYLGRFQVEGALEGYEPMHLTLGPMTRSDMRRVIEEPARLTHLRLEKGLVDDLLDEAEGSDALPLLAFTLRVMWDRYSDDHLFEKREYEELGGITGAITKEADRILEVALAGDDGTRREAVRRAFLRMADLAEDGSYARRSVRWQDLEGEALPALEAFEKGRLLVRNEEQAEVAHEALFRSWKTLVRWLDQNRDLLAVQQGLRHATREWKEAGRPSEDLWRGARLSRAEELLGADAKTLAADQQEFLRESRAEMERALAKEAARQRWILRLAVVAVIVALVAGWQWRKAGIARDEAVAAGKEVARQRTAAEGRAQEAEVARYEALAAQNFAEYQRVEARAETAEPGSDQADALAAIAPKYLEQARTRRSRAGELQAELEAWRLEHGIQPEARTDLFSLEAVQAGSGDSLILHYGPPERPRVMLFDGGELRRTYEGHLRPRLEAVRELRKDGGATPIDLVVSTQTDSTQLNGLLRLLEEMVETGRAGETPPFQVGALWSNAFFPGDRETLEAVAKAYRKVRLLVAAETLGIPINEPFSRLITLPEAGAARVSWDNDLTITVLGPPVRWLRVFSDWWLTELKTAAQRAEMPELAAKLVGEYEILESFSSERLELLPSPIDLVEIPLPESGRARHQANLASIVLMLEMHGKRILLTADVGEQTLLKALAQAGYLDEQRSVEVDVLNLPRGGSSAYVSESFFRTVKARSYLIQTKTKYRLPKAETFEALFAARRQDGDSFRIYLTYPPGEFLPETEADELCTVLERERREGTPFEIVTPREGQVSFSIDLLGAAPYLDRGGRNRVCGFAS